MKRHCYSALALLAMVFFAFGSVDTKNLDSGGGAAPGANGGDNDGEGGDSGSSGDASPSESSESGFSFGKTVVTKAHYDKIKNGMSYREVVGIIGTEGEELSRNSIEGTPGVMEGVETVMYSWSNGNGSNMNAMFQNDKLMQKAQLGLK